MSTPLSQCIERHREMLTTFVEIARHAAALKESVQGKPYASQVEQFIDAALALASQQLLQQLETEKKPVQLQLIEIGEVLEDERILAAPLLARRS